ncbi:MAG: hypothetical protein SGI86_06890, partial [Deltaproteobacteria bacterium]|nr:hypothetical protein [Deltaproteobacteria bacterium]
MGILIGSCAQLMQSCISVIGATAWNLVVDVKGAPDPVHDSGGPYESIVDGFIQHERRFEEPVITPVAKTERCFLLPKPQEDPGALEAASTFIPGQKRLVGSAAIELTAYVRDSIFVKVAIRVFSAALELPGAPNRHHTHFVFARYRKHE